MFIAASLKGSPGTVGEPHQGWGPVRSNLGFITRVTASFRIPLFQKYSLSLNTNPQIVLVGKKSPGTAEGTGAVGAEMLRLFVAQVTVGG